MTAWTPADRTLLTDTYSLVLTVRDCSQPGVEVGMVVVDGALYVRAYRGVRSRWYRAAQQHGHGTIRLGTVHRDVLLTTGGLEPSATLDAAFRAKYGPVAEALVASPEARAATVRIDPASAPSPEGFSPPGR
ncbi:DUF2255 family protein [Streptomyces sp. 351MFTsu5.1]|uniref:DUF2255 family protein n=1 Tax=Streptomyces sp. 351MFTsu5.1 TaxID=1172180 RepID=UPI00037842D3|nr:DUF2255 family protein [Streptomyces sp. 351MFTsu5.1]